MKLSLLPLNLKFMSLYGGAWLLIQVCKVIAIAITFAVNGLFRYLWLQLQLKFFKIAITTSYELVVITITKKYTYDTFLLPSAINKWRYFLDLLKIKSQYLKFFTTLITICNSQTKQQ